jgi:DNA-binding FrmR family transcriptional regulator
MVMVPEHIEAVEPSLHERSPGPAGIASSNARQELLNRLRRAEGQLRGIQGMIERGEDCRKVGQQFSAVRRALDNAYVHMVVCMLQQEMAAEDASLRSRLPALLAELEHLLTRRA